MPGDEDEQEPAPTNCLICKKALRPVQEWGNISTSPYFIEVDICQACTEDVRQYFLGSASAETREALCFFFRSRPDRAEQVLYVYEELCEMRYLERKKETFEIFGELGIVYQKPPVSEEEKRLEETLRKLFLDGPGST